MLPEHGKERISMAVHARKRAGSVHPLGHPRAHTSKGLSNPDVQFHPVGQLMVAGGS